MKTSKKLLVFSYNILGDKMKKELPKVFANKLPNNLSNNERVYYKGKEAKKEVNSKNERKENINVKINKIFKSPRYVSKVEVEITTNEGRKKYKIIGRNQNNIITIENELIPISSIIDITEI